MGYVDSILIKLTEPVQRNAIFDTVSLEQMTGPRLVESGRMMAASAALPRAFKQKPNFSICFA